MKKILAIIVVIVIFGVVGLMDQKDEESISAEYAMMVCGGYWPDYKSLNIDCE